MVNINSKQLFLFYSSHSTIKNHIISNIFCLFSCQKSDDDKQAIELDQDEEYLHSTNKSFFTYRPSVQIACARNRRLKEVHMQSISSRNMNLSVFFSYFLLSLIQIKFQIHHLQKYLFSILDKIISVDFNKIFTVNEYWKWLEQIFVKNIIHFKNIFRSFFQFPF